jgi:hypothetical protein
MCALSYSLTSPRMAAEDQSKEPLEVFADDSTKPDFYLSKGQLRKLQEIVVDHPGEVGLLNAGAGYVKVTLHDAEGTVIDKQLITAIEPE